jgi:hypothetical protein
VKETSEGFIPVAFCFLKNYSDFYSYKERRNQQPLMTKKRAGTVKHCLEFSFVFSAPLPAGRNLFSASGIFCGGRYQPAFHYF